MVAAIIMMTGVFAFARRTSSPWLALLAATPYFIIVMGMSGIRQSMAAGILLFLLSRWERYNFTKRGVYILIAAMFHTSALVNNIFLATKLNIATRYKIIIGVVILIITFYLSSEVSMYAGNVTKYKERYLAGSFVIQSVGSLYHIAMIVIPAILGFIYKKRILPYIHNSSLLNFGLYASMVVLALDAVSSTVASRLTIYLYFLPMMIYPALLNMASRKSRLTFMFFILSFHLIVMIGWFSLGNVAFAYLPYKNVLFDE